MQRGVHAAEEARSGESPRTSVVDEATFHLYDYLDTHPSGSTWLKAKSNDAHAS
jgi:hypothetical protein